MAAPDLALAVDIGGTQIKAGVIRDDGTILALQRLDTPATASPDAVVCLLLALLGDLSAETGTPIDRMAGIGISIAAFITAQGLVTATAHLSRAWIGFDLRARLAQDLPANYYFALDTPAPALGEAYFGAGKDADDFVYMTVSTGIGAGIIANGRYFVGGLGWAGGVGHIIVDETSERVCGGCGNHGCLETFAARQGIVASAAEAIRLYPESRLASLAAGAELTPRLVCEAAAAGDPAAIEVFARAGHYLGIGLTNLIDIVSPSRVVVGGGIALAGDLLLEPARAVVRERAFPPRNREAQIVPAALGDLSGMYGAAAMVFHDLRIN
jgi:glucokinase